MFDRRNPRFREYDHLKPHETMALIGCGTSLVAPESIGIVYFLEDPSKKEL
jgi:hypothetical protein